MNYDHVQAELQKQADNLALAVLQALFDNPAGLSREELTRTIYLPGNSMKASTKDRNARRAVARLRNFGVVVISRSSRRGYRLATDEEIEQVRKFVKEQFSAAKARMKAAAAVRKAYGLKDNLPLHEIMEVMA